MSIGNIRVTHVEPIPSSAENLYLHQVYRFLANEGTG